MVWVPIEGCQKEKRERSRMKKSKIKKLKKKNLKKERKEDELIFCCCRKKRWGSGGRSFLAHYAYELCSIDLLC